MNGSPPPVPPPDCSPSTFPPPPPCVPGRTASSAGVTCADAAWWCVRAAAAADAAPVPSTNALAVAASNHLERSSVHLQRYLLDCRPPRGTVSHRVGRTPTGNGRKLGQTTATVPFSRDFRRAGRWGQTGLGAGDQSTQGTIAQLDAGGAGSPRNQARPSHLRVGILAHFDTFEPCARRSASTAPGVIVGGRRAVSSGRFAQRSTPGFDVQSPDGVHVCDEADATRPCRRGRTPTRPRSTAARRSAPCSRSPGPWIPRSSVASPIRWCTRRPQYAVAAPPTSTITITTSHTCERTAAQNGERPGRRGPPRTGAETTSGSAPVLA